jgi:hypothetical protein
MTDAPDTAADRLAEYQPLVITALVDRERTGDGIRFPFRADPGLEDWFRDLAAREKACCAFFTFDITMRATRCGGTRRWSTTTWPAKSSTSTTASPTPSSRRRCPATSSPSRAHRS